MPVTLLKHIFFPLNNFQVLFCRSWSPAEALWLRPEFLPFMVPHTQAVNASTHWPCSSLHSQGCPCRGPIPASGLAGFPKSQGFTSCPLAITYCKQALSVLAWKLLNSDSAGKHSKMGRTVLKKVKNNQILLGMTWKKN